MFMSDEEAFVYAEWGMSVGGSVCDIDLKHVNAVCNV